MSQALERMFLVTDPVGESGEPRHTIYPMSSLWVLYEMDKAQGIYDFEQWFDSWVCVNWAVEIKDTSVLNYLGAKPPKFEAETKFYAQGNESI
jgi:hypothetical protein